MVKHSRLAKNRENRESFPPRTFYRIQYTIIAHMYALHACMLHIFLVKEAIGTYAYTALHFYNTYLPYKIRSDY